MSRPRGCLYSYLICTRLVRNNIINLYYNVDSFVILMNFNTFDVLEIM